MERQSVLGRRSLAPSSDSASAHRGLRREVLVLLNLVVDALELDLLRGGDGPGGGGRPACGREGALASHHSLLLRCNSLHCSPLHTVPTVPLRVDLGIALGAACRAWPWMNAEASDMARTSEIKLGRKGFHGILCSPEFCALLLLSRSRARLFFFPHRVDSQFSLSGYPRCALPVFSWGFPARGACVGGGGPPGGWRRAPARLHALALAPGLEIALICWQRQRQE